MYSYKSRMELAGGRVTYCSVTSAPQGQMIRHLRSRRAQWPKRESTPKTTRNLKLSLAFRKSLEVKLGEETFSFHVVRYEPE